MAELKYVILEMDGEEHAVMFSKTLIHKDVAEGIMRGLRRGWDGTTKYATPVAAGFVTVPEPGVPLALSTRGESESLGLKSRRGDAAILTAGAMRTNLDHMSTAPETPVSETAAAYDNRPYHKTPRVSNKGSQLRDRFSNKRR